MPTLDVNGTTLHYEDTGGGGPPIVFSHGLLWSGRMYAAQVEHLRGRFRCITYDHRGQGQSPPSARPYDMEALADDAAALIDALGARPCHFVGLSMGGFVGMRLAARRPELLRSLVLLDTAADGEPRRNVPKYRLMALVTRLVGYRPLLGSVMKIMFGPAFRRDPARAALRRELQEHLLALRVGPTQAALEAVITRRPVVRELGRIHVLTTVVEGADDAAVVHARARATAGLIPGARYVEIPRAGHTATVEEPAAVNAALDAHFAAAR